MKLGLLGFPISHSHSPKLYRNILGAELESYKFLELEDPADIPTLDELKLNFDGLNITSPHKKHFFSKVIIDSLITKEIQAINTLSFNQGKVYGINTDVIAVEMILQDFKVKFGAINLKILGSGVMARVTTLVADSLQIPTLKYYRGQGIDLTKLDLNGATKDSQTIVINTCSRDFIYQGEIDKSVIFWDYNYDFSPHKSTLSAKVKTYIDGQEMLEVQAKAAVRFWNTTRS